MGNYFTLVIATAGSCNSCSKLVKSSQQLTVHKLSRVRMQKKRMHFAKRYATAKINAPKNSKRQKIKRYHTEAAQTWSTKTRKLAKMATESVT